MTKYRAWIRYFEQNQWPAFGDSAARLNPGERDLIRKSIRQFQLGEGSDGYTFLGLGREFAAETGEPDYVRSLELFVAEEQRHSRILGHFMDLEGIPRQTKDAADSLFRMVRQMWGHECMIVVLVSAECVAVPYYSALHDATGSPLLRTICRQILRDEAMHLKYQGQTLARLAQGRGFWLTSLTQAAQKAAVFAASLMVFTQHRGFFRAVGWELEGVLEASFQALAECGTGPLSRARSAVALRYLSR